MFLKRMELQGFKSFADKSVIHFNSKVIGIVGPNGCGKSNINDAIRWVLGEQSVKSLRGNTMSDVIFNGSTQRKAVNMAEVTLVFDNTNRYLDIDYKEVEITRRLYRINGEGEYFINKTPCRLKDIHNLVMDSGLGKDSLSIISQGNISSFADAKPEERRALFEEAAGVLRYKKRKQESLLKLERMDSNLARVEDIIIELERQIKPLEIQAKKANEYLEKKEDLEEIEISVLVYDIEQSMKNISNLQEELFYLDNKKTLQETTIQVEENKINETKKVMYQLDQDVNHLQEEYTNLLNRISTLEKQKVELDEKRKYALEYASKKEKVIELKNMMEEAKYEYKKRESFLQEKKKDLSLYKQQLDQIENHLLEATQLKQQEESYFNRLKNKKEVLNNMLQQPFQYQHGVKAIMENQHTLSGVYGVVSQLINPILKYEEAIANALGGAVYHIVTKDEFSARQAIAFLKKNSSGRATFLPLNIMKAKIVNQEILLIAKSNPGCLGIVSDYVNCENIYTNLKLALLGNIFLCNNLESANEVAKLLKYKFKVVTVDGEVVHPGGSMTGGKSRKSNTPLTIQNELNQLLTKIEGQSLKVENANAELKAWNYKKEQLSEKIMEIQLLIAQQEPIIDVKCNYYEKIKLEYLHLCPTEDIENTQIEADDFIVKINELQLKKEDLLNELKQKRTKRLQLGSELERKEGILRQVRREIQIILTNENTLLQKKVKEETHLEHTLERLSSNYEMTFEYAKQLKREIDIPLAKERVNQLKKDLMRLGNVNVQAPQELEELKQRNNFLITQKKELIDAKTKLVSVITSMDETMVIQFQEMFEKINYHLNDVFTTLFGGGRAILYMDNPDNVLETGIDIEVQPPGKTVQNLRLFSGGEKALIAICVLFSILRARTIPLCIFDEVEAALDQANVDRFAKYIQHFKEESQFIVVTHRQGTMAQCDELYGVTMQKNGVSSLLTVKLKDALKIIDSKKE